LATYDRYCYKCYTRCNEDLSIERSSYLLDPVRLDFCSGECRDKHLKWVMELEMHHEKIEAMLEFYEERGWEYSLEELLNDSPQMFKIKLKRDEKREKEWEKEWKRRSLKKN
jgi:hypothetical protein